MIAALQRRGRLSRPRQPPPQLQLQRRAEALHAPLAQQHLQPRLLAARARPVVAEHRQHRLCKIHHIVRPNPGVQRHGQKRIPTAHRAAHQHVETHLAAATRRREREIVRLRVRAVVRTARNAQVELARQIAEPPPPTDDHLLNPPRQRRGVDQLARVDARQRAAHDVPHIVHPRLLRGEIHRAQPLEDVRRVRNANPAQLDVLPRRDVRLASPVVVRQIADRRQLLCRQHPVGDAQPQHEIARRRLAVEQPVPLQTLQIALFVDGLLLLRVAVQVGQHIQPVLGRLDRLNRVRHRSPSPSDPRRRRLRQLLRAPNRLWVARRCPLCVNHVSRPTPLQPPKTVLPLPHRKNESAKALPCRTRLAPPPRRTQRPRTTRRSYPAKPCQNLPNPAKPFRISPPETAPTR